MPHDRRNHRGGKLFARERLQNLRFREIRIVEDDRDDVRVAFGEEGACDAGGSAARQRNFLAERQLWQAPEQLILGVELQLRGYSRRKRDLNEIHQIKITEKPQADQTRRARMKSERPLHPIALQEWFAPRNLFEDSSRKVFSFEQHAKLRLVERRIVEKCEEHIGRRMMQEGREFFARGNACAFTSVFDCGHASFRQPLQKKQASKPDARRSPRARWKGPRFERRRRVVVIVDRFERRKKWSAPRCRRPWRG